MKRYEQPKAGFSNYKYIFIIIIIIIIIIIQSDQHCIMGIVEIIQKWRQQTGGSLCQANIYLRHLNEAKDD